MASLDDSLRQKMWNMKLGAKSATNYGKSNEQHFSKTQSSLTDMKTGYEN